MHQAVHLTDPDKSTTPGDGYRTDHQKITVRTGGCCPDVGRNELRPYPDRARTVAATRRPAASSAKLLSHLGRPVGEDVLRPGTLDPGQRLQDRPVPVDPALLGGGLDHRVLAGDLIRGDRHVDGVRD